MDGSSERLMARDIHGEICEKEQGTVLLEPAVRGNAAYVHFCESSLYLYVLPPGGLMARVHGQICEKEQEGNVLLEPADAMINM